MRSSAGLGVALAIASFVVFFLSNYKYDAGRGDLFYLADSFLHGRTWIDQALGPQDIIRLDGRIYVPFPPFPAIALMPLVAVTGPELADRLEPVVNASLAAVVVGLAWWFTTAAGVDHVRHRFWLVVLLAFSTQIWWVTTRGGVWHTGHLVATILTLLILLELWGSKRPWLVGLLAGAAFLTRPPLAFAVPILALFWLPSRAPWATTDLRDTATRSWLPLALGVLPSMAFFFIYNAARFGSPLESGYALAIVPPFLEAQRQLGLFSLAHVPMNIDYLLLRLPQLIPSPPFFKPDGLGMSILLTSPGLLLAARAPWSSDRRAVLLLGCAIGALVPNLLYYGGGWLQYGFRYGLDAIPYAWALAVLGVARSGLPAIWRYTILFGVLVMAVGVYWAYNL